jgi:hypothetical protein
LATKNIPDLNVDPDDVELDGGLDHAHDGEDDGDAGHGGQVEYVAVPVRQLQAIVVLGPGLGDFAVQDQPHLEPMLCEVFLAILTTWKFLRILAHQCFEFFVHT